ncbi:MAG: NlpC/P60 family protein [Candidatus Caldarchaeum sp.]
MSWRDGKKVVLLLLGLFLFLSLALAVEIYRVEEGDTIDSIAGKFGCKPDALMKKNGLSPGEKLEPGRVLRLPESPSSYLPGFGPAPAEVVITGDRVNLRKSPSQSAPVVDLLSRGMRGKVLERKDEWYKIRLPGGKEGWVFYSYAEVPLPEGHYVVRSGDNDWKIARHLGVSVSQLHSANPGVNWRKLQIGQRLKVPGRSRSTLQEVRSSRPPTMGELKVVAEAKALIGTRYRYGGETTRGFDCSGFVYYLYKKVEGIELPRTSRAQANVGIAVSRKALQPGDIVLFRTRRSRVVNHSGIYLGGGIFAHASSHRGRVRIDSLTTGYYSTRFVTARRVKANLKRVR